MNRVIVDPHAGRKGGPMPSQELKLSACAAQAAGFLSWLVPGFGVLRAVRSRSARTAITAASSIRSGSPCRTRERRASSAPALRIAARSSALSGARDERRAFLPVAL